MCWTLWCLTEFDLDWCAFPYVDVVLWHRNNHVWTRYQNRTHSGDTAQARPRLSPQRREERAIKRAHGKKCDKYYALCTAINERKLWYSSRGITAFAFNWHRRRDLLESHFDSIFIADINLHVRHKKEKTKKRSFEGVVGHPTTVTRHRRLKDSSVLRGVWG